MSKHNNKKSRLKYVFLAFTCAAAFAFSGIASACGNSSSDEEKDKTTTKEDTQLLKNGNFEFFTIPDKKDDGNKPEYLIKSVENWSHGGTNSYAMSGIISTSKVSWDKLDDPDLAIKLDLNNELDSSSSTYLDRYVDYNGMKSSDILYKNQYEALKSEEDYDEDNPEPEDRKDRIANPGTHYNVHENADGDLFAWVDGEEVPVYVDDDEDSKTYGDYFLKYDEESGEYSEPISNILMLHNYATTHNGIAQDYSSVSVELPANTAAEISVWVKTAHLKHDQGLQVDQDRGANITVTQTVGNSSLDKFMISCINTEKLLGIGEYEGEEYKDDKVITEDKYNGWVQYTVYVNACDFASTTIKIELGLGETGYTTEGYAFFDDVSVTKFVSLDNSSYEDHKDDVVACNLSSDKSEKIFKADVYKRNNSSISDMQHAKDFYYLIDLASEQSDGAGNYTPVNFEEYNLKTGLTVDDDDYISSKNLHYKTNNIGKANIDYDKCRLPFSSDKFKEGNGLKTEGDYLALVTTGYEFKSGDTEYYEKLNKALNGDGDSTKGAAHLPKNSSSNSNNMLVMMSAYGAAYTTSFDLTVPRVSSGSENDGYQIVSFWVKTSDMGGSTAATIKITQTGKDENTSNFIIDTTNKKTNIGDTDEEKDIYDGWVQCFFFVKNELEVEGDETSDSYTVEFSFGNTTINGTDVHSYKSGWVALANMQYLNVNEDIFSYTSSGDYTASLTISEEAEKNTQAFDSTYGNQSQAIKNDMVNASSYKGVNGGSSAIVNNGHVSIPFDEFNNNEYNGNKFTGLINKEHFLDGNYKDLDWYETLLSSFNKSSIDATQAWNEIFGEKSYQPLVITNKMRESYIEIKGATEDTFKNGNYYVKDESGNIVPVAQDAKFDEKETYYRKQDVMNYGYIGDSKTVSSNSYSTISVRVKVSAKATAYVYLVDTSAGKDVLSFSTPHYSFYYDVDGNVLKDKPKDNPTLKEQRENIAYTLRDDGLYEDEDGKLYANLYNYSKLYYDENINYYDINGVEYSIENLVDGVTYYKDKEHQHEADHYLVTTDGIKLYRYLDGNYYYIVDGETQSDIINKFDTTVAKPRYEFSDDNDAYQYVVEIKGSEHTDWVTVTFVLQAGSESKSYRLELWSGKREETQTDGNEEDAVVIFDYSYSSISSDDVKSEYEQDIINEYLKALNKVPGALDNKIDTTGKNILYFEKLVEDLLTEHPEYKTEYPELLSINPYNYKAYYYTYSLYDSANFQPFNKTTASDDATGYDYSAVDQSESLAYLRVETENEYNVFVDYSAIDQSISLNNASDTDDDDDDNDSSGSNTSIWLLASSIILVVALIFAIVAIFLRDVIKKTRRNRVTSKNQYDQRKANRYKRRLHLKSENIVEVDADETTDPDIPEEHVEEVPEANEAVIEEPVEEAPAPVEVVEETTDDEPSDNSDKQE